MRVWRREGEHLKEDGIQHVEPYNGGSIMCWAGISTEGRHSWLWYQEDWPHNATLRKSLEPHVVSYHAAMENPEEFQFMDDNDTPHPEMPLTLFKKKPKTLKT